MTNSRPLVEGIDVDELREKYGGDPRIKITDDGWLTMRAQTEEDGDRGG